MYPNPWLFREETFDSEHIGDNYGFVYLIENQKTGKKYIGKKFFFQAKRKQVNKKRKRYLAESDWKEYYGSNSDLLQDIEEHGKDSCKRTILHLCKSKGECSYYEAKEQFSVDCLRDELYYNKWIIVRVHEKHLKVKNGTKAKLIPAAGGSVQPAAPIPRKNRRVKTVSAKE